MTDAVRLTLGEDGVALLEMNRPDRRNAFSDEIKDGLRDATATLSRTSGLRALVFTGSGGTFCAGGDLKAMLRRHEAGEANTADDVEARMNAIHAWFRVLRDMPVPVIVAVDGPAVGAGLGLALVGDLVLASETAVFGATFAKVGAVPDCNLMWSLPRIVGLQRARELFYTARLVDAQEALRLGLCLEVLPRDRLMDRAREVAAMMAETSPEAFALTKEITGRAMQSDSDTILAAETAAQRICLTSAYHIDAVTRFAAKARPRFDFTADDGVNG